MSKFAIILLLAAILVPSMLGYVSKTKAAQARSQYYEDYDYDYSYDEE